MTDSSIFAGVRVALVQILLAQVSSKPVIAEALEVIDQVKTDSPVETGHGRTVIGVDQAVSSFKSGPAFALITSVSI